MTPQDGYEALSLHLPVRQLACMERKKSFNTSMVLMVVECNFNTHGAAIAIMASTTHPQMQVELERSTVRGQEQEQPETTQSSSPSYGG